MEEPGEFSKLIQSLEKSSDPDARRCAAELVKAMSHERRRLARRVHDGLQQFLTASLLKTELARREIPPEATEAALQLSELARLIQEAGEESRWLVKELRKTESSEGR